MPQQRKKNKKKVPSGATEPCRDLPSVSQTFNALQALINYAHVYIYMPTDRNAEDHVLKGLQGDALSDICQTVFPPVKRKRQYRTVHTRGKEPQKIGNPSKKRLTTYTWAAPETPLSGKARRKDLGANAAIRLNGRLPALSKRYNDFPELLTAFQTLENITQHYPSWRSTFMEKMLPADSYHMCRYFKKRMRIKGRRNPVVIPHSTATLQNSEMLFRAQEQREHLVRQARRPLEPSPFMSQILGNF